MRNPYVLLLCTAFLLSASAQTTPPLTISSLCTGPLSGAACVASALSTLLSASSNLIIDASFTVDVAVTLNNVATTSANGVLLVGTLGSLIVNTLDVQASSTLLIAGSLEVTAGTTVEGTLVALESALIVTAANLNISITGDVTIYGTLQAQQQIYQGGSLTIGNTTNPNNTVASLDGVSFLADSLTLIYSSTTVSSDLNTAANSVIYIAASAVVYVGGNAYVQGNITNAGLFDIQGGSYVQSAGNLILNDSLVASQNTGLFASVNVSGSGTVISGLGNINGDLVVENGATISPGNSPGTIYVNGDISFSADATYRFEVDNNGNAHDLIVATGTATLNGFVDAYLLNSAPSAATTYTGIQYASRTGTFASVTGENSGYTNAWTETDSSTASSFAFSPSSATSAGSSAGGSGTTSGTGTTTKSMSTSLVAPLALVMGALVLNAML